MYAYAVMLTGAMFTGKHTCTSGKETEKKNYAGSEKPLPTLIKEKEPLQAAYMLRFCHPYD
jgi:hypothetical protein